MGFKKVEDGTRVTRTVRLVLVSVLLLPGPVQGQSVQIGIRAGGVMASTGGADADHAQWRQGVTGGLAIVVQPAGRILGFESGLSYTQKGTEYPGDPVTSHLRTAYLDVPLLLRVALPLGGASTRPVLLGGASVSLRTGCRLRITAGQQSNEWACDDPRFEGTNEVGSVDVGMTIGLAVDIPTGGRLVISPQATYTKGAMGLYANADYLDVRNEVAQFQVGIRFR